MIKDKKDMTVRDIEIDFISDCGMFKITLDKSEGLYYPCIREGDGQDRPIIFSRLSKKPMSFEDAQEVLNLY